MLTELNDLYPIGSDITIMNTYYNYPVYQNNKKISDDFLCLVYKDNKTGKKDFKIINNPEYTYYLAKPGEELDYNRLFIEKDKVEQVTVPFNQLEKSIAEKTNVLDVYKANLRNRNKSENRKLHTNPNVFYSDANIQDHYRFKFAQDYTNNISKLNKGFIDIEVDGKFAAGNFVEMGECEINCVSYLDNSAKKAYTFILRNSDNPLIEEFENEIKSGKFGLKEIREMIIESVGGIELAKKYDLLDIIYEIKFYDSEIDMIKDIFTTIHVTSPDFVETWNGGDFDINYIIERIKVLGYDPADIMCDPRWPIKVVKNYVDLKNKNNLAERGDYTFISGLPVFIDQMIQYASRRKSKIGSYKSFKLDDIGLFEAKIQKLDYSHITNSVTELPWLDFKTFVVYNIMDVIVQKAIEMKTNDLEYIYSKCLVNNTIYQKGHRQTVYLINRISSEFYKLGYIIGNNINRWNEKPDKFAGAIVGDPLKTDDYSKLTINGRAIWICDNLQDYDYKSLYPSVDLENNIAPNTQIGRIEIPEQVYSGENPYQYDKYTRGGDFVECLVTDNTIEYCKRWFGLAGIEEFIQDMDEYYTETYKFGNLTSIMNNNSPILDNKMVAPISFNEEKEPIKPFVIFKNLSSIEIDNIIKEKR